MNKNNVKQAKIITIAAYIALILSIGWSTFAGAPDASEMSNNWLLVGVFLWTIKVIPLLIFIPFLIKDTDRVYGWMSYVSMIYFILAILLAFTPQSRLIGTIATLSSCILFVGCLLVIRWGKSAK
jgi:uncharacterized membrane protein